jgi:hypothetical protein
MLDEEKIFRVVGWRSGGVNRGGKVRAGMKGLNLYKVYLRNRI